MTRSRKHKTSRQIDKSREPTATAAEPKDWQCLAAILLLVGVYFREILLGNAYLWEDFLFYNYPVRNFAATTMAMGQMPLWNPYTFNGMPFLADIQTTVFYIPCTILVLFVKDGLLNFYWLELVIILHYVLAGAGMFYLAKSLGIRRIPSLFSGVAYMLSGFMITHAIHQQIITLVAWYPLVLLLFRKALKKEQWRWVFLAALVLGHSVLAGHPQLSLFLYFLIFVFFLFELLTTHTGKALLSRSAILIGTRAASIVAISVAVAMIQLLPTLELSDLSQRAEITYEKATEGSLAWSQLTTLIFPKIFGTAGADGYHYHGPGTYWYYWETCIYLGTLPLILMVLSAVLIKRNKYVAFLWGLGIFAVLFALGNDFVLHKMFFDFVPGFSKFRNPARIGIFLSLAAALLSGFSIQHLLYEELTNRDKSRMRKSLLTIIGAGTAVWALIVSGALDGLFPFMKNEQLLAVVRKDSHIALVIFLISGVVVYALFKPTAWTRWIGVALIAIIFVDMSVFGAEQNNAKLSPSDYFRRSDQIVQSLKRETTVEFFRVKTRNPQGMIMDRNQGMIDRIFMMEGYTPLALQRVYAPLASSEEALDLLNTKYKTVTDERSRSLTLVQRSTYFPRAFFLYEIDVVHSDDELLAYLKSSGFDHSTTAVLEKEPGFTLEPPSTKPEWSANIIKYENNNIVLNARTTHDGLLVLSEIFYPGWKAYLDGTETEIYRTDYNLRSLFVPKGTHTIEVRFEPLSYTRGVLITLGALALCASGTLVSITRSRRAQLKSSV
ncbi:MAG: hypothetical protein O7D34_12425 [Ignavibacteria bacterium]|nr:hypothetical protein [Ignavibacteria bacterium]